MLSTRFSLAVYLYMALIVYVCVCVYIYVNPDWTVNPPIHPFRLSSLGVHTFVLYVCVSFVLQIRSSTVFL